MVGCFFACFQPGSVFEAVSRYSWTMIAILYDCLFVCSLALIVFAGLWSLSTREAILDLGEWGRWLGYGFQGEFRLIWCWQHGIASPRPMIHSLRRLMIGRMLYDISFLYGLVLDWAAVLFCSTLVDACMLVTVWSLIRWSRWQSCEVLCSVHVMGFCRRIQLCIWVLNLSFPIFDGLGFSLFFVDGLLLLSCVFGCIFLKAIFILFTWP